MRSRAPNVADRRDLAGHLSIRKSRDVEIEPYDSRHLTGIVELCEHEGWRSLPADLERAQRILTNPGVTTSVATDGGEVIGFIHLLSDGEVQAYVASMAVAEHRRREGIGRRLIEDALHRSGGERIDLLSCADDFYEALGGRRVFGFRLRPPFGVRP